MGFIDYIKSKWLGNRTYDKSCVFCSPKDHVSKTLEENSDLSEEEKLYKMLSENQYKEYPYEQSDLGEDMTLVNQEIYGYWKPRYLIDERNKTAVEFMSETMTLQTLSTDDIDWESLNGLPQYAVNRAKGLNATYPTFIHKYKDGVAEVSWQLNPEGRYYMDEDGYGMTDDEEIAIYGFIDRAGRPLVKLRDIYDISELDGMEKEAIRNLETTEAI